MLRVISDLKAAVALREISGLHWVIITIIANATMADCCNYVGYYCLIASGMSQSFQASLKHLTDR